MSIVIAQNDGFIQYIASGGEADFAYDFPIFDQAHVVILRERAGVVITLTIITQYTVTDVGVVSGGDIVLAGAASPADAGDIYTLIRDVPEERTTQFQVLGDYKSGTINKELELIWMTIQQLRRDYDRSMHIPLSDPAAADMEMPVKATRATKIASYDVDGNPDVVSAVALPSSLVGKSLNYLRVNSGETDYEFRTAANLLLSLLATEGNGLIAHVGSGVAEPRTITGTSAEITVTDGDGVSGNPVLSFPSAVSFAGITVTGDSPSVAGELATKGYVDSVLAGVAKRGTVRVASTANITIATALNSGDTIDGIVLANGDLVLLTDQTAQEDNGVYVAGVVPVRDIEYDTWDEIVGSLMTVQEGTANEDSMWLNQSDSGGTLETTGITYTQVFPGAGGTVTSVGSGDGLSGGPIVGSGTLAVDLHATPGLEFNGGKLRAKAGTEIAVSAGGIDLNMATVAQVDAEAGTATDRRIWTAERVKQAIEALGGGGLASLQVFTGDDTWTKPAGITKVRVLLVGGGGGGGGSVISTGALSGSGGAAGYAEKFIDVTGTSEETITVGAGGTAGIGGNDGANGGSSSFGAFCSATAGLGGINSTSGGEGGAIGGAGGTATGGDINIDGQNGSFQSDPNSPAYGGSTPLGNGGKGFTSSDETQKDGKGHGSGGGGGHVNGTRTGGAGAGGVVMVWEYK